MLNERMLLGLRVFAEGIEDLCREKGLTDEKYVKALTGMAGVWNKCGVLMGKLDDLVLSQKSPITKAPVDIVVPPGPTVAAKPEAAPVTAVINASSSIINDPLDALTSGPVKQGVQDAPPADPAALRNLCNERLITLATAGKKAVVLRILSECGVKKTSEIPDAKLRAFYDKIIAADDLPF